VSHLGINPVKGGSPPSDKNKIGKIKFWFLAFLLLIFICDRVLLFVLLSLRKIGVIKREYTIKYIIVGIDIFLYTRANIHPMCVIDEYARIVRRWV